MGISADIIILTHLTASSWPLRTEKLPWLTEADCRKLDLCRADSPLRSARHAFHHLIHASDTVILIDATGLDDDCQPATPLAEWLTNHSGADTPELVSKPQFLKDWGTASGARTRGHHLAWRPASIEMIEESGIRRAELHLSGRGIRDIRQRAGLSLRMFRQPVSPPLNPSSISLPLDSNLMLDRLRREPTIIQSGDQYLGMELHDRFCGTGNLKMIPGNRGAPGEVPPRSSDNWPVLGGKSGRNHLLAIDPRPLKPSATSLPVFDQRHGMTGGASFTQKRWSASRLQRWQACPRQGWLERRLNAGRMEQQEEDLDARIRGNLVHGSLGALFQQIFSLDEGDERSPSGATSVALSGHSVDDMYVHILDYIGIHAPWLEREDATAAQRRHDLIGMPRQSWLEWLASPKPLTPSGRLGNMLNAEMVLYNSIPISIEWSLNGMTLPHPDWRSMKLTGFIDRVDVFNDSHIKVPFVLPEITNEDKKAIFSALNQNLLTDGPKLREFENKFAKFTGAKYAIGVSNATAALHLSLKAIGIGKGDEVIIPGLTFVGTANAVLACQAVPVLVDVDPVSWNIDISQIELAITSRTRAIVPVHLFGLAASMSEITQIAETHGLVVIEDACEAIGGRYEGDGDKLVGSLGDGAVFGFYPNKVLTTGEGGMVVSNSPDLLDRVSTLANQGRDRDGRMVEPGGFSARISELTAAIGRAQLMTLNDRVLERRNIAQLYARSLNGIESIRCPVNSPFRSWFTYPIQLLHADRSSVQATLLAAGIESADYFPAIHLLPGFAQCVRRSGSLKVSESLGKSLISLPFFASMTKADVEIVTSALKAIL